MTSADVPGTDDRRALLQSALEAIDELQAELARTRESSRQPIAIVGMSCRFPGGASSPEAYWELLRAGRDVVGTYADHRRELIEASGVEIPLADAESWHGGFLDDVEYFDPQFFGVSPREAASMDPQQRLVLETSWEALERAGIAPDSLNATSSGVFVGVTGTDYAQLGKLGGPGALDVYSATGGALNAVPGRVAYTLGLQGPSMAIDTACSSSLVALHEACVSLRLGESDLALAGGVNVLLLPEAFVCFDRWGMMAPDGRCKTFDAAADGFVRGEGCGMVVLKRLSDAVADRDPILAVIRGSAVNQDGRSSGLTVPNGPAQQAVLRKAYASAGVDPADVQYFEAHGTGTTLGDPIEIEAMGAVLGAGRDPGRTLHIGSVKTNIGHLESAAGIAGVMKVVLAMQHGEIPPHLHFQERSPQIPWPDFDVRVPTDVVPWTGSDGRRVAGVSGFGFSGTNAHVVLESPPEPPGANTDASDEEHVRRRAVVLSARDEQGLVDLAGRTATWLGEHPELTLPDVAATANTGRAHLPNRLAVVAESVSQLADRLSSYAAGSGPEGVQTGRAGRPRIAFAFTGQGSQYVGMARDLYESEPAFRAAFDRCASLLDPLLPSPLLDVVFAEPETDAAALIDRTRFTQPALFAVEYALAALWQSWGIVPEAVMGHSVGEIVAATVAGVMSLDDATTLIAARGSLMQELPPGGSMAAIFASAEEVAAAVAGREDVAVAAVNGPAHSVVSGAAPSVAEVAASFTARGVRVQELVVSHAFHSPLMAPMLSDFRRVATSITYRSPNLRLISNVTGDVAGPEIGTADYWVDHVMAPVRFAAGVEVLHASGIDTFVEIGPHPVLCAMGQSCIPADAATWVPSLRRNRDDVDEILAAASRLHTAGATVSWADVQPGGRRTVLPTAGFDRQRYWVDPPRGTSRSIGAMVHPLLGVHTAVPVLGRDIFERTVLAGDVDGGDLAWLADHRLYDAPVMPGTAYAEIAIAASRRLSDSGTPVIRSLAIREPLVVDGDGLTLQTVVGPAPGGTEAGGAWEVQICSFPLADAGHEHHRGDVTIHAVATVANVADAHGDARADDAMADDGMDDGFDGDEIDIDEYYEQLADVGIGYGPAFRGLSRLRRGDRRAVGTIEVDAAVTDGFGLHPAQLDACFHVVGAAMSGHDTSDAMYLPVGIEGLTLFRAPVPTTVECRAELIGEVGEIAAARLRLDDLDGGQVATIERLDLRRASRSAFEHARRAAAERLLYDLEWCVDSEHTARELPQRCVLVSAGTDLADRVEAELTRRGAEVTVVGAGADGFADEFDAAVATGPTTVVSTVAAELARADDLEAWRGRVDDVLGGGVELASRCAGTADGLERLVYVSGGGQAAGGPVESPVGSGLAGLVRTVVAEVPTLECRLVDLDPGAAPDEQAAALVDELAVDPGAETVVALRGTDRLVARLRRHRAARPASDGPLALTIGERGSLDRLSFRPMEPPRPGRGEIGIEVHATGINFRDVLNVLGMYPGDPGNPGLECAGVVTEIGDGVTSWSPGDHVFGIAPNAYDDHVVTRADLVVAKPAAMSFAEAAAIPIAFLTAHFGLHRLAGLRRGERVLIHAAAGGVGLAGVHLANAAGAEIFATASSPAKHRLLRSLGVEHVYSSRSDRFAEQLLVDTDGAGVDVVLNSLSDELVDRSFECLATGGRFLEIGKRGIWTRDEAAARRPDATYFPYDLADVVDDPGVLGDALEEVADRIARRDVPMLPLRAFPAARISEAFRFIAQARHVGKVVVAHDTLRARGRFDDGAYLVTGGLGGLGLEVAEWLAERGAGAIVLAGRSAPSEEVASRVAGLGAGGTRIEVVAADVSSAPGVESVLDRIDATELPLRGVVHAAGVVDDAVLADQSRERLAVVAAPKLVGGWLLDRHTRGRPLDFFVAFSSASALLGSPGQANYATANAALDGLMSSRTGEGSPGVSIEWGAWSEVGMASQLSNQLRDRLASRGIDQISPALGRHVLSTVAAADEPVLTAVDVDWARLRTAAGAGGLPPTFDQVADATAATLDGQVADASLRDDLEQADAGDRLAVVREFVRSGLVRVLGLDPALQVDVDLGFTDFGLDSLMAVEFANRLSAGSGLALPTTVAFEYPTLAELADHVAEQLGVDVDAEAEPATSTLADEIEALSADDVETLLLQELKDTGY